MFHHSCIISHFSCKPWISLMPSTKFFFFFQVKLFLDFVQKISSQHYVVSNVNFWCIENVLPVHMSNLEYIVQEVFSRHWFMSNVNFWCIGNVSQFIHYVLCALSPICTWWFNLLLLIILVVQFLNLAIIFSVSYYACFVLFD